MHLIYLFCVFCMYGMVYKFRVEDNLQESTLSLGPELTTSGLAALVPLLAESSCWALCLFCTSYTRHHKLVIIVFFKGICGEETKCYQKGFLLLELLLSLPIESPELQLCLVPSSSGYMGNKRKLENAPPCNPPRLQGWGYIPFKGYPELVQDFFFRMQKGRLVRNRVTQVWPEPGSIK